MSAKPASNLTTQLNYKALYKRFLIQLTDNSVPGGWSEESRPSARLDANYYLDPFYENMCLVGTLFWYEKGPSDDRYLEAVDIITLEKCRSHKTDDMGIPGDYSQFLILNKAEINEHNKFLLVTLCSHECEWTYWRTSHDGSQWYE